MAKTKTIEGTTEAWEAGLLGTDAAHVRVADAATVSQVDDALGLQMISIRLPKGIIETFKMLAKVNGVGYQPLMRDALCRFAEAEMKQLLVGAVEATRQTEAAAHRDTPPPLAKAA